MATTTSSYDQFVASVRAMHEEQAPGAYPVCGYCGDGLSQQSGFRAKAPCGHTAHGRCLTRWPNNQTCGHCLDELQQQREQAYKDLLSTIKPLPGFENFGK